MKNSYLALVLIFSSMTAQAVSTQNVDIFGYARAGVGTNSKGGEQECFYNQGAGGWGGIGRNELRLGNECSNYLEVAFKLNHLKASDTDKNFFYTQFRLSNSHLGNDTMDSASQENSMVELFAEGTLFDQESITAWVGKRFYRENDVYMDDYYYLANMSGNGGGVGNIPVPSLNSTLDIAYLKQISGSQTDKGKNAINVLDFRLKGLMKSENFSQNLWLALGTSPGGTSSTGVDYQPGSGFALGLLTDAKLNIFEGSTQNQFAIVYGNHLLNGFNLWANTDFTIADNEMQKERLRLVNHTQFEVNPKLDGFLSLAHEDFAVKGEILETWNSIGISPVYHVTDRFRINSSIGGSWVHSNAQARQLIRVALAPEIAVGRGIWARPVLRAFYTHSFWSENNKPFIKMNAPAFENEQNGGSYGLQMESFF